MTNMRRLAALVATVLCLSACHRFLERDGDGDGDDEGDGDRGIEVDGEQEGPATGIAPLVATKKLDGAATRAANARCDSGSNGTVTHSAYRPVRDHGTARRLRGKVGIVVVDVSSAKKNDVSLRRRTAKTAALGAKKALLREAKKADVDDLSIDLFLLPIDGDVSMQVDPGSPSVGAATNQALARMRAKGHDLRELDAFLRARGYRERAVMVHTTALVPGSGVAFNDGRHGIDVAFFDASHEGTMVFAHELLHLFGADDLYDIARFDPHDTGDIMALGHGVCVKETTAWAIGWSKNRPVRSYFGRPDFDDLPDESDIGTEEEEP